MAYRWINTLTDKDITPHGAFLNRRQIMGGALAGIGLAGLAGRASAAPEGLEPNSYEDITSYNNYYEFGTGKDDPARYADRLTIEPWTVQIDGLVDKPGAYGFDDIMQQMTIEERIYRFRCVEAWSMVVPWNGFELADLLTMAGVQSGAKYVSFETALRPDEMPGVAYKVLDWPYVEGLRLDEAMHPLTI
ncbi:MAG: protein-methionine-sulfoxide reductase catalytic subunit MsrP, partial [Sulfitobacter litoralis]|nr:protein-methionine-sulfoxide reductase catalytic subunit MsrP [Sulfitobacter litoralis]